jgi:Cdc6-like AAA superfamily ATPase
LTKAILASLELRNVYIDARAAVTARQIYEEIYRGVADLVLSPIEEDGEDANIITSKRRRDGGTESQSVLAAKLDALLRQDHKRDEKVVIVLDGIDQAKELTNLAGLIRLGDVVRIS